MNNKVIFLIACSIIAIGIAALNLISEKNSQKYLSIIETKPTSVSELSIPLNKTEPKAEPTRPTIKPLIAYSIYKSDRDFVYIDASLKSPDSIVVLGESGQSEAAFVEEITENYKVCDETMDRSLRKYKLDNPYGSDAVVAFPNDIGKFDYELINSDFETKPLPETLKKVIEKKVSNINRTGTSEDILSTCSYTINSNKLEMVECNDLSILFFNGLEISSSSTDYGSSFVKPIVTLKIGNERFIITTFGVNGDELISIKSDDGSKSIHVEKEYFSTMC